MSATKDHAHNMETVRAYYLSVVQLENDGIISGSYANNLVESLLADLGLDYDDFMTE